MKLEKNHILEFQKGNRTTFQDIFDKWYDSLCMFANRYLNDIQASEDIVQESFISLWNNREQIESANHLKAFLYQVTRNNCINHLKQVKIRSEHHADILKNVDNTNHFINFVIEEEANRLLYQTQKELPPKCREIFLLSVQGLSNNEIAEKLDISVNTVKTQKKIAYKKLKEKLSEVVLIVSLLVN